jgi:acylphosphatase
MIARRLIVRGKVQGVFFRNWAQDSARSLRVTGWVRNRRSGEVEILVMGPEEDVDQFTRLCWRGPFGAKVEDIESSKATFEPLRTFDRRPTA